MREGAEMNMILVNVRKSSISLSKLESQLLIKKLRECKKSRR